MTPPAVEKAGMLEKLFHLTERRSSLGQEVRGGLVTFFAMAYILVLNPIILSGPDSTGGFLGGGTEPNQAAIAAGTALVAGLATILMGAVANFPLGLAAGLGLNSMLAATIVQIPGMTWADGMGIIVLEGIVVVLLVVTGLREAIFRAVPTYLRTAISVGIVQGTPLLDLEYVEDVDCDTDMNVVMTGAGHFVEVQGTAEGVPFTRKEMDQLLALAEKGITELVELQAAALSK